MSYKLQMLATVWFILVSFTSTANEQHPAKYYYDATSIVVGGESQNFVVGQGENIIITAGESIRLLPGTRIEAGGKVQIEVSSTAKPKATEERQSVLQNPELLVSPFIYEMECSFSAIPDPEKLITSAGLANAVMPVQVSNASKNLLKGKNFYNLTSYNAGLASNFWGKYLPILAWGERPETIKVLRT